MVTFTTKYQLTPLTDSMTLKVLCRLQVKLCFAIYNYKYLLFSTCPRNYLICVFNYIVTGWMFREANG